MTSVLQQSRECLLYYRSADAFWFCFVYHINDEPCVVRVDTLYQTDEDTLAFSREQTIAFAQPFHEVYKILMFFK